MMDQMIDRNAASQLIPDPPFPSSVKVGFLKYKIEDWDRKAAANAARYGETAHMECCIRIDMSFGSCKGAQTLIHELMHASMRLFGDALDRASMTEEAAVTSISNGIGTIWQDNPEVFRWIAWHIVHGD